MRNMKLTCANVADDRGLVLGTGGYDSSWNVWMIVEFINERIQISGHSDFGNLNSGGASSKGTTWSSIFSHNFGHLCGGRRI